MDSRTYQPRVFGKLTGNSDWILIGLILQGVRLLYYPRLILSIKSETGLFAFLFCGAALVALVRPTRQDLVLLSWIAPILIHLCLVRADSKK
jgi:hypothetical protein